VGRSVGQHPVFGSSEISPGDASICRLPDVRDMEAHDGHKRSVAGCVGTVDGDSADRKVAQVDVPSAVCPCQGSATCVGANPHMTARRNDVWAKAVCSGVND